ncbi:hypothetical protein HPP92_009852 [Vanilla planifolia]|uniref:Uncharacterized protein n=1 Tax=Vanilla planifolia TaxID=51239 RepID=A0A835R8N2_VANPL|nr:hypothetical protein HPP92_009852 [Vanilla planifolia]
MWKLISHSGPLRFNVDDFDGQLPNLYANPYAWTKISNLLFVDWSIGTGFSYSKDEADYTSEDVKSTKLNYKFIRKPLNKPARCHSPDYAQREI